MSWLFTGFCIGFAEEVVTRGFVVGLMRKAGHPEIAVGVTLLQVVYTILLGLIMYLALRVTGNFIWPVLLHASTNPTIFLHGTYPVSDVFSAVSTIGSFFVILTGIVLLIVFIVGERGRTSQDAIAAAAPQLGCPPPRISRCQATPVTGLRGRPKPHPPECAPG